MKLQWRNITDSNMHGKVAVRDNRKAEVVRCYQTHWTAFYYIDGKQVVLGYSKPYRSFNEAKSDAALFLNTERIRLFNR